MRTFRLLLLLVLGVAFALSAWAREPLVDPDPIAVPEGLSREQVAETVKSALIGRTWSVTKQRPGRIEATLFVRKHAASIEVSFDETQVQITYKSSVNLDYKERRGRRSIHDNYLDWIQNLVLDIGRGLQNATIEQ